MFILDKKRILLIVTCVFVSIVSYWLVIPDNKSIETVSLPVSGKVIVLDAGHGIPDEGAQSSTRNNRSGD